MFLFIPALPPSQVSCDPALVTFLFIPKNVPTQTVFRPDDPVRRPSRSAARRAAQDLLGLKSWVTLKMSDIRHIQPLSSLTINWLADQHICRLAGATEKIPITIKMTKWLLMRTSFCSTGGKYQTSQTIAQLDKNMNKSYYIIILRYKYLLYVLKQILPGHHHQKVCEHVVSWAGLEQLVLVPYFLKLMLFQTKH